MQRRNTLERRLFGWMLALALVPALVLVVAGTWVWAGSIDWIGTLGPWVQVAESGRAVLEAAENAARTDSGLAAVLETHRNELSASLLLARRWAFIGERIIALVPMAALILAGIIVWSTLRVSRHVARELARPIQELADWSGRIGREESLPPDSPAESREVEELRVLRESLRNTSRELQAARRRALEAERLRVWGEMARRVAHEMKNPLTPLRLAAHRLARSAGPDVEEPIAVIAEETGRLEELAHQFASLGRPPTGPRSAVDLVEMLEGLLETDVPPHVARRLTASPELPLVEGHYEPLLRAFRNLVRNAVESMEGFDGERRVEIRIERIDSGDPGDGGWVEVVVGDQGHGIPSGMADQVFEPDYTTKSRGTGLGLTLVRQAVVAHGGEVTGRNRPDGGAEFVVRLPVGGMAPVPA